MKTTLHIDKSGERSYHRLSFAVPENAERIDVRMRYPRYTKCFAGGFVCEENTCVIDLALETPTGQLAGAAGSNRAHVFVSPLGSSDGFAEMELSAGDWCIVAGAYRVPEHGVDVDFEIDVTLKHRRLLRGDTHAHTSASDGVFPMDALAGMARGEGLDFLFITDHNNVSSPRPYEGVSVLPGVEWTHYQGHANFLGSATPFPGRYDTRSLSETIALMQSAQEGGALVVLNHPFCPLVPWLWGYDVPFDALEVWNGAMSERNERAVAYWHGELCKGRRIPALGGSDYHAPGLLGSLATPTMCLYALSRSCADVMDALRRGDGFITYLPNGPAVDVDCETTDGRVSFGGVAPVGADVTFMLNHLAGGDEIRLITDQETERIVCPPDTISYSVTRRYFAAKFVRVELSRVYAPGLPPMKALLSNPVYFE
jgi:hypothetical protein